MLAIDGNSSSHAGHFMVGKDGGKGKTILCDEQDLKV